MSTAQVSPQHTPEDVLTMPGGKHYEVVNGQLVERDVSALSSLVAAILIRLLGNHCEAHGLAWVFGSDCGFRCFPGNKMRRADVSFVHRDRLPADRLGEGYIEVAPDLAVEVVSPHDLHYDVEQKVDDYLGAGVRLVWVVNPDRRTVRVYRGDRSDSLLRESDELTGEAVLPGFRCVVRDLFPPAQTAPQATPAPAPAQG